MLRSREEWADGEGGQVGTAARVRASVGHAPSSFQAIRAAPGLCAYQHVQPALCSLGQRIQGKKTGVARQVPRVSSVLAAPAPFCWGKGWSHLRSNGQMNR